MNETQDATHFQEHRDDEAEWGEPERAPSSERRRLASMVSVRFSPDEAVALRQAAEAAGESLSNFVRQAALSRCRRERPAVGVAESKAVWQDSRPGTSTSQASYLFDEPIHTRIFTPGVSPDTKQSPNQS